MAHRRTPAWICRSAEDAVADPGVPVLVSTGIAIELPPGYEAQVRPRSGLALRFSITLPNSPATIDPGYRGEIRVILLNMGSLAYRVERGDRIAQLIVARYEPVEWEEFRAERYRPRRRWLRLLRTALTAAQPAGIRASKSVENLIVCLKPAEATMRHRRWRPALLKITFSRK